MSLRDKQPAKPRSVIFSDGDSWNANTNNGEKGSSFQTPTFFNITEYPYGVTRQPPSGSPIAVKRKLRRLHISERDLGLKKNA